ncbi:MAG: hypothetical protein BGO78_00830 [Chloroflexi bacterium 44-23]|nr:MAG: hypothetical protein BGO78_00830 [Chloroflexi bacterium 44-23]
MINKLRFLSVLLILALLAGNPAPVSAQDYYFSVERQLVDVIVNEDGSLSVEYTIDFVNQPNGAPIDYVDIGLPNNNYVMNSISAEIDGKPLTDISRSDYVDIGVAIGLGANAIQPGKRGQLHVYVGTINKSLYPSDVKADEPYASFEFSPSYFGSQYVTGSTDMTVTLYLPTGLSSDEPRYNTPKNWPGQDQPDSGYDNVGGVYYRWHAANADVHSKYTFGASFPARNLPESQIVTAPAIKIDSDAICPALICLGFLGFFILTIYSATVGAKKRKLKYLPPKIALEGQGIKRGLTAVEAAILMEQPMDKVMTMILFSTLKKEAAEVVTRDPLEIKAVSPAPAGLQLYEKQFLDAMLLDSKAKTAALQTMMTDLVNEVSKKMKGFSRKESIEYYKDIMERAWNQVETAQTPEVKSEKYEENMDWTMLDRKYDDRTRTTFGNMPVILPMWWWRYDPTIRPVSSGGGAIGGVRPSVTPMTGSGKTTINLPNLPGSDFAASITNGVQSFSAGVVGDISKFTGAITNKTNPIPQTTSGRSTGGRSGGGGSSCACACACAGCACACAGGGR